METKDYLQDIREIKNMMSQSSQFISLSGLSGILAGIYSLIGAYLALRLLHVSGSSFEENRPDSIATKLLLIAAAVMLLSVITVVVFSAAKAKKQGGTLWNPVSKRLLINFCIPLFAGGIFSLLLLDKGFYLLIAPVTMLFYGLACLNASKFTLRDIRYLGISMIVLGLTATYFIENGLLFWAIGFGFCNILYGALMYFKYDRK